MTIAVLFIAGQSSAWPKQIPVEILGKVRQALVSWRGGDSKGALPKINSALADLEKGNYTDDPQLTGIWHVGSQIRREAGDYPGALAAAQESLALAQPQRAERPEPLGQAYISKAMAEASLGDDAAALDSARLGLQWLGRVRDPRSGELNLIPRCAITADLAGIYDVREDYLRAEHFYRLAARDADVLSDPTAPPSTLQLPKRAVSARAYSAIGGFYSRLGDHRRALPKLLASVGITKQMPPGARNGREDTHMSLSRSFRGTRDYTNARRYAELAVSQTARGAVRGDSNAKALATKAAILGDIGEYAEALELQRLIGEKTQALHGSNALQSPSLLNNIGWLELRLGKFDKARELLTRARSLAWNAQTKNSEGMATISFSLAELEVLSGNHEAALQHMSESMILQERALERVVAFGSDAQKLAFLERQRGRTSFVVGAHFDRLADNEDAAKQALSMVLQKKGRLTRLVRAAGAGSDRTVSLWRSRLGSLGMSLGITDRDLANRVAEDWMLALEEAERKARWGEEGQAPEPMTLSPPVDLQSVSKRLGTDEVLIEFVVYQPYSPDTTKSEKASLPLRCGVLVLDAKGRVRSKDLGEYEPMRKLAAKFRHELAQSASTDHLAVGEQLYEAVVAPWLPLVVGSASWKIAPDGQLHLVPFGALREPGRGLLLENYLITYLGSGSELGEPRRGANGDELTVTIFANPDFDSGGARDPAAGELMPGDSELGVDKILEFIATSAPPLGFPKLDGTLKEAQMISKTLPSATFRLGANASESNFKRQTASSVIHVATHGFFLGEKTIADRGTRGLKRKKPATPVGMDKIKKDPGSWFGQRSLQHPLLNCGLAFAGANNLHEGVEDGILTGLEVLGMDLGGTSLVVLSACETGLGEVVEGEGVFGLRQAFRMAGASSLVLSLWKVDDQATATLMAHFYSALSEGQSKGQSLRQAALKLRSNPKWQHPAYWAAFLLSGHDGKL